MFGICYVVIQALRGGKVEVTAEALEAEMGVRLMVLEVLLAVEQVRTNVAIERNTVRVEVVLWIPELRTADPAHCVGRMRPFSVTAECLFVAETVTAFGTWEPVTQRIEVRREVVVIPEALCTHSALPLVRVAILLMAIASTFVPVQRRRVGTVSANPRDRRLFMSDQHPLIPELGVAVITSQRSRVLQTFIIAMVVGLVVWLLAAKSVQLRVARAVKRQSSQATGMLEDPRRADI